LKNIVKAAGLSLVVLSSSFFANAAEAAQKIGYVNTAQIFQALPQREAVQKKLQAEFKDKAAELKALQAKIQTKVEQARRDGELLGEDGMRNLQIQIAGLEAEYKIKGQALEKSGAQRENQEKAKLFKVIQTAIGKVAEKEGYDIIVDASALQFAKPDLDLSEKVINELK